MNNRRRKKAALSFCGGGLVLWASGQFFQFVQLYRVGDSPPHFVTLTEDISRKRKGWRRNFPRVNTFYRYEHTDKLRVASSINPAAFLPIQSTCIYDNSENLSDKPANPNVDVTSTLPYLQMRLGKEIYQFAEGSYGAYFMGSIRYFPAKIFTSGPYLGVQIISTKTLFGGGDLHNWLIIWKRGQKQPIYHCPIHGELRAFALTK